MDWGGSKVGVWWDMSLMVHTRGHASAYPTWMLSRQKLGSSNGGSASPTDILQLEECLCYHVVSEEPSPLVAPGNEIVQTVAWFQSGALELSRCIHTCFSKECTTLAVLLQGGCVWTP